MTHIPSSGAPHLPTGVYIAQGYFNNLENYKILLVEIQYQHLVTMNKL